MNNKDEPNESKTRHSLAGARPAWTRAADRRWTRWRAKEQRRRILAALQAEVEAYVERFRAVRGEDGRAAVVRNGGSKPRQVTLGSGTVTIEAPRVNDKRVVEGERQRFQSAVLPPYLRRSQNVSELLPLLCTSTCG